LLLGRLGLKPKPELRRELSCDLSNGTLAAHLKHHGVERTLRLPSKLEGERGLSAFFASIEGWRRLIGSAECFWPVMLHTFTARLVG
jgi:hypothetical protein